MMNQFYLTSTLCFLILSCNTTVTNEKKGNTNVDSVALVGTVRHPKYEPLPAYDSLRPPPLLNVKTKKILKKKIQQKPDSIYEREGFVKAIVFDNTGFDGCSFMIQLENRKHLEPTNLTTAFKKDGLQVWLKYESCRAISVCMAGEIVCITAIEKRSKVLIKGISPYHNLRLRKTQWKIEMK